MLLLLASISGEGGGGGGEAAFSTYMYIIVHGVLYIVHTMLHDCAWTCIQNAPEHVTV